MDTKFQPGQSGNPAGKPRGVVDKRSKVRRMLEEHSQEMVDIVLDMARERDPTALKLIFERISPKPKSDRANLGFDIDKIKDNKDLMGVIEKLMISAVAGDLPDDQGKTIASLTKTMSELHKLGELEDRIKALEGNG
jgi:hypothetical protein